LQQKSSEDLPSSPSPAGEGEKNPVIFLLPSPAVATV